MFRLQLRNELLKLFARKRTYVGFGVFAVLQLALLTLWHLPPSQRAFRHLLESNGYAFEEYFSGLTLAFLTVAFTFMILGAIYLGLVGGDIVAKEVEDGTMRMILSRPVSRLQLLFVKWLVCALFTFVMVTWIGSTSLLAGALYRGGLGKLFVMAPLEHVFAFYGTGEGLWRYARAILFLAFGLQAISTLAFMFSCFNMKPATATILTLSVFFVDMVLRNIEYFHDYRGFFITYHIAAWVRTFQERVPWSVIGISLIYLAAWNITFWVVGAVRFCSRDFKSS
jgi:ABC-2 type transport system permease protein